MTAAVGVWYGHGVMRWRAWTIAAGIGMTLGWGCSAVEALSVPKVEPVGIAGSRAVPPEAGRWPQRGFVSRYWVTPRRAARRVPAVATPWAPAGNSRAVIANLDRILRRAGVGDENVRVRMIAHAIVASGWQQKVWHYNAWGVKRGEWPGPYYVMSTQERTPDGRMVTVWDAQWRAFSSWDEAVRDFFSRIRPDSDRPSYREAAAALRAPRATMAAAMNYWQALGKGNYYTATAFTPYRFALLCGRVRAELRDLGDAAPADGLWARRAGDGAPENR